MKYADFTNLVLIIYMLCFNQKVKNAERSHNWFFNDKLTITVLQRISIAMTKSCETAVYYLLIIQFALPFPQF